MKPALNLTLRRVRSSLRTDVNTGSRNTQAGPPKGYNSSAQCASKITTKPCDNSSRPGEELV